MKYPVIYADPPWAYKTWSAKGRGRSADAHYDVMTLDDIKAFPIDDYAAQDCVLLLWVIDSMLPHAHEVLNAWHFTYKTVGFYWVKLNPKNMEPSVGLGHWTRANPEQCWLAARGHPHRISAGVRKLIFEPRRQHSQKPYEAYNRIEKLLKGPYLEIFARSRRDGWDQIGDEVDTGIGQRRWPSDLKSKRQRIRL
jgi:N6-adenosine-specific RNA methylase IME4